MQGVPLPEGYPLTETDTGRQHLRRLTGLLGEIEPCHLTTVLRRQGTRRAPKATTNVKHVHARAQPGKARQLPRALPPAVVLLIKRRQVVPGQGIEILASRAQRGENLRTQLRLSIVLG